MFLSVCPWSLKLVGNGWKQFEEKRCPVSFSGVSVVVFGRLLIVRDFRVFLTDLFAWLFGELW